MPTTTVAPPRRAHSVPAHPSIRRHRGQVARWALANGHLVERDALAALVAVRADQTTGVVTTQWTAQEIGRVLWSLVPMWCAAHHVAEPRDLATTAATYLRYLSAHRLLEPGSDSITALRRSVADHRPTEQGSRARHPAAGRSAPVLPIC